MIKKYLDDTVNMMEDLSKEILYVFVGVVLIFIILLFYIALFPISIPIIILKLIRKYKQCQSTN